LNLAAWTAVAVLLCKAGLTYTIFFPSLFIANRKMRAGMSRFYTREELVSQRQRWRRERRKVVFTNGCYDILHPGHIGLLERARSLGDVLILALNTDSSVQRLKGPSRPFFDERTRAELALHLEAVDAVTLFDEDTPRELIAAVLPDVLVKGADWSHFIAGREEVEENGGEVFALPLEPGYSTTDIAAAILAQHRSQASMTNAGPNSTP
jgi:rfaE bifunctional protein nucleotidyltransferase chain/domain